MPLLIEPGERKLLFIHIPKTAGTSVKSKIKRSVNIAFNFEFKNELPCPPQHFHYELLQRLGITELTNESFAIVRDPLARFISEYSYRKKVDRKFRYIDLLTFSFFIQKSFAKNKYLFSNHMRPQIEFLGPKTRIFKVEDGLEEVFKYYPHFFEESTAHRDGQRSNMSNSECIYVDDVTVEIVKKIYKEDFLEFGYTICENKFKNKKATVFEKLRAKMLSSLILAFFYLKK
jgi:hypothetical protein